MSGPYRFQGESARSPLDRAPQNVFQTGQPPSFKTNVNRMKTKKWVEAKKNAYDGDDWGEYDEFDEYGADTPPQPAIAPPGVRQPGQALDQAYRSFTDPQRPPIPQPGRRNSFEAGEEHRAFSATHSGFGTPPAQPSQGHGILLQTGNRQPSGAESEASDTPYHRRDFSPSAMPPPLQTRMSPPPGGAAGSPTALSPSARSPTSANKPLPFIRPADIYKRVEEERQKERSSMESSRPSFDSEEARSPTTLGKGLQPLETVTERKSDYLTDLGVGQPSQAPSESSNLGGGAQPPAGLRLSAFESDFWSSSPQLGAPVDAADPGFRAVVDQAFMRTDDERSVPPTPVSKQSDSDVTRSNTASTTGISPIMSRIPSSATSALKNRGTEGSTPVITEEDASEGNTPLQRSHVEEAPTDSYQFPQVPSTRHSRNVSGSSVPRTGLATPTPTDSPARSPAIEPQRDVPQPESAVPSSPSQRQSDSATSPLDTFSTREADIVTALRTSPDKDVLALGAAEKSSQLHFLETHQDAHSPMDDAPPRSRSQSPSKGRVQELAGKFGEVAHSRRGSTQSNMSRTSIQSWERSQDNSRPSSPTKGAPTTERPSVAHNGSFRPKLPGQWESFATTIPTPSESGEKHLQSDLVPDNNGSVAPLNEIDLTPTTAKHAVPVTESSNAPSDSLAALKKAGAAMGEAIQNTVGLGGASDDSVDKKEPQQGRYVEVGDVYLSRPLHFERTASSVASSIPPTPPAKDTPEFEHLPPSAPPKDETPEPTSHLSPEQGLLRPGIHPQLSTAPSDNDQESDRLRKEIVASLSPVPSTDNIGDRSSLQPNVPSSSNVNRESSILPSEYESYWSDREPLSEQSSHDPGRNILERGLSETEHTSVTPTKSEPTNPSLLTRFSWENSAANLAPSEGQAEAGAAATSATNNHSDTATAPPPGSEDGSRPNESSAGFPDPYFGPGFHAAASTNPEPLADSAVMVHSPTPPRDQDATKSVSHTEPKSLKEPSTTSGLHVVNSEFDPEAVDMPPRLSVEGSRNTEPPEYNQAKSVVSPPKLEDIKQAEPPSTHASVSAPAAVLEPAAKSPTSDKPLGFRDIANIKSSSERIATYNTTREYWANTDHGLSNWLDSSLASNPEIATQPMSQQIPVSHTSTSRHRATGSLSLFGKHHAPSSSKMHDHQSPTAGSAGVPLESHSGGLGGRTNSFHMQQAKDQMQAKGKDLLHTAGLLSGKGMTGAKGLFAKGKSRFRGSSDKDTPSQSSREASEEPEFVTTRPATPDTKKKSRRLSSPFHRSNRSSQSRSRPNSVVLPFGIGFGRSPSSTRGTPPEKPRPYSYHAPEDWNVRSDPRSWEQFGALPRQPAGLACPERLGVLPSPAKSTFSLAQHGDEGDDVPPVPPLPEGIMEEMARGRGSGAPTRAAYETMVIGAGDVSPITMSVRAGGEDTTTAAEDAAKATSSSPTTTTTPPAGSELKVEVEQPGNEPKRREATGETAPPAAWLTTHAAPRLAAASSYVVHAVQYVPSHSSFESWEQESVFAPSQSDGSQLGDRHEPGHEIPPIPPVPQLPPASSSLVLQDEERVDQGASVHDPSTFTTLNIPTTEQPMWQRQPQDHLQASAGAAEGSGGSAGSLGGLKHSQSLLSAISSAVSAEGTQISPVSSQTGQSRPSSRTHQPQVSPARLSPAATGTRHVSENPPAQQLQDDYDLYADANGDVLVDGRNLRVAAPSVSPVAPSSKPPEAQSVQEEEPARYSEERPMSFISSPQDASGRPQDQINRSTPGPEIPPVPQVPQHHQQNGFVDPNPVYSQMDLRASDHSHTDQARESLGVQSDSHISLPQSSLGSHHGRDAPSSNVSSPPLGNAAPTAQPQVLVHRPLGQGTGLQNGTLGNPMAENFQPMDPRIHQVPQETPTSASHPPDPRAQRQMQGPHFAPVGLVQSQVSRPIPPAVSQNEPLQQMQVQQANELRLGGPQRPINGVGNPLLVTPAKGEDRSSSRPRLSSVFKGLAGKTPSDIHHGPNPVDPRTNSQLQPPHDSMRSDSYQSHLGDLPSQQDMLRTQRRPNVVGPATNRPESMGGESHLSHISQESTRVQAAGSRLDLRYPSSPAPFHGIPPQHPPPGSLMPPNPAQSQRHSTPGAPTSGKKKRFSALGALFGRSSSPGHDQQRTKLSKEEKKAQKAQKHVSAQPTHRASSQQWPPPAQQQNLHSQPNALPYGAPTRVIPNANGMPPYALSSQVAQGPPQQYMPPHGYEQHLPRHTPVQRSDRDESAFMASRQTLQFQQQQEQLRIRRPQGPAPLPNQPSQAGVHSMNPSSAPVYENSGQEPPPGGYFKPDSKPLAGSHANGSRANSNAMQQATRPMPQNSHQERPPTMRHVSTPAGPHVTNMVPPITQRRVTAPLPEPQYDTPQIPAAYNPVSGAFVSPGVQPISQNAQSLGLSAALNGGRPGRQYSDPDMQPISPQVSAQSQTEYAQRTHSNSIASMVSAVSNPSPRPSIAPQPPTNQRSQQQRMSSITEAPQHDRPWNLDIPPGATEQEIVRIRHHQYMEQQLAAQQQLQAERSGQSSPHLSRHTQSPSPHPQAAPQSQGPHQHTHQQAASSTAGGFRELLPRSSQEVHPADMQRIHRGEDQLPQHVSPHSPQHGPHRPGQGLPPTAYPLPISPDAATPVNPLASALPPPPPPKIPHSPMRPAFTMNQPLTAEQKEMGISSPEEYGPDPAEPMQQTYDDPPPDEPPPSYFPLANPRRSMDKDQIMDRQRPPNIVTNADSRAREHNSRERQASLGLLQHPQPATMAASPRSPADMGADFLRRQLLEQEERDRMERLNRAAIQRAEAELERQERDRARARARELEQSVSNGGRVGSLRSVGGSGSGRPPGWEQRSAAHPRPVFELSAEEDDEPVMRATSFPGQEWVPTFGNED